MAYTLLWSLLFVLSTSVFQFGFRYGGIDRTFRGLNKGAAESAVVPGEKEGDAPRFLVAAFVRNASSYFSFNLSDYVRKGDYEVDYAFYDEATRKECAGAPEYCTGLGVSLLASVGFGRTYRNHVSFWLVKGTDYE
ncbi:MAG: hypothetical protein LKK13_00140 [Bacilli bacterium]|jgi:hypothetical protein|nr:hypothetical protein [Bacilli bacterium]